jgi:hypothetical protein
MMHNHPTQPFSVTLITLKHAETLEKLRFFRIAYWGGFGKLWAVNGIENGLRSQLAIPVSPRPIPDTAGVCPSR